MAEGRIQKALSGFYYVDTGAEVLTCRARGKFRKEGLSPLVGDRVTVRELASVDQGDLQIFHHIGTQKCQCQRIKYINPLKISNLKSSVQFGKQGKHQTVDCDQYPVTFAPERLVDLSSVNGIPHPCKDRRLCQNHQTRQTKYDKSFIIFSFTHVITSVSL